MQFAQVDDVHPRSSKRARLPRPSGDLDRVGLARGRRSGQASVSNLGAFEADLRYAVFERLLWARCLYSLRCTRTSAFTRSIRRGRRSERHRQVALEVRQPSRSRMSGLLQSASRTLAADCTQDALPESLAHCQDCRVFPILWRPTHIRLPREV